MDNIKVQIRYTIENFNDALYFSFDDYAALSQEELDSIKQQRYSDWLLLIEEQSNLPDPTEEEIIAERFRAFKEAIAQDEFIMNSILDIALVVAKNTDDREELRSALLDIGDS